MFEHMKNHEKLMAKVSRALKPGGKFFLHIFCHKDTPYDYEDGWMTTHFFTGGTMMSFDLLLYHQQDLKIQKQWWVNGNHYSKTCEVSLPSWTYTACVRRLIFGQDWLSTMIKNREKLWPHFEETYGKENAYTWYCRWQIFYMACSELFAFDGGDTWGVGHYLFEKPQQ